MLLHTIYRNINKQQGNANFFNRHYHNQYIKYVQHKNVKITWYYWKFPRHPVFTENFETRGINTILLRYKYRVYSKLGKGVCENFPISCARPACVAQLNKY